MSPKYKTNPNLEYTLWQLPCKSDFSAMAFVIKSSDGSCFVIDGGSSEDAKALEDFIIENCGEKVDAWFITGPAASSAGAVLDLLKSANRRVSIEKLIYAHAPAEEIEKYSRDAAAFAEDFNLTVKSCGCQKINVHTGERIKLERALVRVFSSPDACISDDFMNNACVVYKFNLCCTSLLFLANIGREAGTVLLENYKNELSCDILQISGSRVDLIPDDVYRLASPETCLWCTSKEDWDNNEQIGRTRKLLDGLGVTEHKISDVTSDNEIKITY